MTPEALLDRVDAEEIADLVLRLARIESPTTHEGPVADFLEGWLGEQGWTPRRVALVPERPDLIVALPGAGGGIFTVAVGDLHRAARVYALTSLALCG